MPVVPASVAALCWRTDAVPAAALLAACRAALV